MAKSGRRLCFWEGNWPDDWTPTGCMSESEFIAQQADPRTVGLEAEDLARVKALKRGGTVTFDFGAGGLFRVKRTR